jgi:hypothetical protein
MATRVEGRGFAELRRGNRGTAMKKPPLGHSQRGRFHRDVRTPSGRRNRRDRSHSTPANELWAAGRGRGFDCRTLGTGGLSTTGSGGAATSLRTSSREVRGLGGGVLGDLDGARGAAAAYQGQTDESKG